MKQTLAVTGGINGWHVLFGMIAFFLTVTAVNGVMIYDAISTFGGDTPDAYRTGLHYNQRIAQQRQQDQLSWTEESKFDTSTGIFSTTLKDRDGHGLSGLSVKGSVGRPATDRADRAIIFNEIGSGTYRVNLTDLSPGTWDLSFFVSETDAKPENVVYRSKARLWKQP
ncbi:FixH family protein [Hyphomicrobium sp.]|uniref:FixH family protein n=1 Tax=Hyphomicrobium sp. TaxID=82 RepID=UPI000FA7149C|nr:FixH family protein [Hyphomicrobium sp.]RUO98503.1 MAG: nitrogen fixation protein FixH [Hyphomicrobium sp.]